MVLFYLHWEKDNDNLSDLNISKTIENNIIKNLEKFDETDDDRIDDIFYDLDEQDNFLTQIYSKINFKNLYNYIYNSMHKFQIQ